LVLRALVKMKVDGWKSGYASVDNVLRHLQRKSGGYGTPSYAAVEWYAPILKAFCAYAGKDPDQLLSLPKKEIGSSSTPTWTRGSPMASARRR